MAFAPVLGFIVEGTVATFLSGGAPPTLLGASTFASSMVRLEQRGDDCLIVVVGENRSDETCFLLGDSASVTVRAAAGYGEFGLHYALSDSGNSMPGRIEAWGPGAGRVLEVPPRQWLWMEIVLAGRADSLRWALNPEAPRFGGAWGVRIDIEIPRVVDLAEGETEALLLRVERSFL
jgi:hypothetical protein